MDPVLVQLVWNDAWADLHEQVSVGDVGEKHKATLMETVGWLLRNDEVGVSLFNERCLDQGDGTYRGRTFVLKAMIVSVTPIVKPRKPRRAKTNNAPNVSVVANSS